MNRDKYKKFEMKFDKDLKIAKTVISCVMAQ